MNSYMVAVIRRELVLVENAEDEADAIRQVDMHYPSYEGIEIAHEIDPRTAMARVIVDAIV